MSCPRPDSDFDVTRTRGAPRPKTKFGGPLLAHPARSAGPGASKVAIFLLLKIRFFGQIFCISNPTDMFAIGFWQVFSPEMSSLSNFGAILRLGRDTADHRFWPPRLYCFSPCSQLKNSKSQAEIQVGIPHDPERSIRNSPIREKFDSKVEIFENLIFCQVAPECLLQSLPSQSPKYSLGCA